MLWIAIYIAQKNPKLFLIMAAEFVLVPILFALIATLTLF